MELLSEDAQARANSQDSEEDSFTEQDSQLRYDATPPPPYPGPRSRTGYTPEQSHPLATQLQCTRHDANLPNVAPQGPRNSQLLLPHNPIPLPSSNPRTEFEQHSPLSDELTSSRANVSSEASTDRGK